LSYAFPIRTARRIPLDRHYRGLRRLHVKAGQLHRQHFPAHDSGTLQRDHGGGLPVVLVYLLVSTSTLLLFGKLGDRFGLRKVFFLGYLLFTIGSLLCGVALSLDMLILSRFIQGIGCAMLTAIASQSYPDSCPTRSRGGHSALRPRGRLSVLAVGAPAGGIITGFLSWRWVFLVNVPFGIFAMYAVNRYIPDEDGSRSRDLRKAGFDILGAGLSFAGLALLVYGLNTGREFGWTSPRIMGCFALAIVLLAAFLIREIKCDEPLLDLRLFKKFRFSAAIASTLFAYMLLSAIHSFSPSILNWAKNSRR
jgi:MFS family permease